MEYKCMAVKRGSQKSFCFSCEAENMTISLALLWNLGMKSKATVTAAFLSYGKSQNRYDGFDITVTNQMPKSFIFRKKRK